MSATPACRRRGGRHPNASAGSRSCGVRRGGFTTAVAPGKGRRRLRDRSMREAGAVRERGRHADSSATETCIQLFTEHQLRRSALDGLSEGVQELTTCARNMAAQACDDFLTGNTPGCFAPGAENDGETCLWDEQCQSGYCDLPNLAIGEHCGTCSPHLSAGDPCLNRCGLLFDLPHGLACALDTTGAGQCVPLGSEGTSCDSVRCETNLICTPASNSTRTCSVPSATFGEACDPQLGPFCDTRRGIYCNPNTHSCDLPRIVGEGETCGATGDGSLTACDARTSCGRVASTDPTGTCIALFLADGSACQVGSSGSSHCEFPAVCAHAAGTSAGTCQVVATDYCATR